MGVEFWQMVRDRLEGPLFGDAGATPWLFFLLFGAIALGWMRILAYME